MNGRVRTEEGTYAAYGQKLTIERGIVDPSRARWTVPGWTCWPCDPARTSASAWRSAAACSTRVCACTARPDMPDHGQAVVAGAGRGSTGVEGTDTALLQQAALGCWPAKARARPTGVLRKLGIDEFSIRQTDGEVAKPSSPSASRSASACMSATSAASTPPPAPGRLIYRIARRFTLRAQSGRGQLGRPDLDLALRQAARGGRAKMNAAAAVVQWIERAPPKR